MENDGQNWSDLILIDTNFNYVNLEIVGSKFVKFFTDSDMSLYMQSSINLIDRSKRIRINTVDSSVEGEFTVSNSYGNKVAFVWKDKRSGHQEIFLSIKGYSNRC